MGDQEAGYGPEQMLQHLELLRRGNDHLSAQAIGLPEPTAFRAALIEALRDPEVLRALAVAIHGAHVLEAEDTGAKISAWTHKS